MSGFLGSSAGLTFALLLAAATFMLYFFKHLSESVQRRRHASAKAERLVGALYAEIKANIDDLKEFFDHAPPLARAMEAARRDPAFRPHFTGVSHSLVYESHLAELASLPHVPVVKVVAFYSQLERLSGVLSGFDRQPFENLPPEGRERTIEELWRNVERAERLGRDALHALEVHAPMSIMKRALSPA